MIFGQRRLALPYEVRPYHGDDVNAGIGGKYTKDMFQQYLIHVRMVCSRPWNNIEAYIYISLNNEVSILESLTINARTLQYHMDYIKFMLKSLKSVKAFVTNSFCIQPDQPHPRDKWQLYGESLNTEVTSRKLKLASTHFCQGKPMRAASVLNEVVWIHCRELQSWSTDKETFIMCRHVSDDKEL